jgi:hypothetical protein
MRAKIYHGGHRGHGGKNKKEIELSFCFPFSSVSSVSSVVKISFLKPR